MLSQMCCESQTLKLSATVLKGLNENQFEAVKQFHWNIILKICCVNIRFTRIKPSAVSLSFLSSFYIHIKIGVGCFALWLINYKSPSFRWIKNNNKTRKVT